MLQPHQQRIIAERDDMWSRWHQNELFLDTVEFQNMPKSLARPHAKTGSGCPAVLCDSARQGAGFRGVELNRRVTTWASIFETPMVRLSKRSRS